MLRLGRDSNSPDQKMKPYLKSGSVPFGVRRKPPRSGHKVGWSKVDRPQQTQIITAAYFRCSDLDGLAKV
jgi:hypothetical protein